MYRSGILVLTKHVSCMCGSESVKHIIAGIKNIVNSTLYVHLGNTSSQYLSSNYQQNDHTEYMKGLLGSSTSSITQDVFSFISNFYAEAAHQCSNLDVNILLSNIANENLSIHKLSKPVQCIIADSEHDMINGDITILFQDFIGKQYNFENTNTSQLPVIGLPQLSNCNELFSKRANLGVEELQRGSTVLGGTFDHIHNGHKVLLSEAALLTNKRMLIGITDGRMLEKKTLYELIKPWESRKDDVASFLCDIADLKLKESCTGSDKILDIVQILDPIGPASTDPDLQWIVVSRETEKGGKIVNEERLKNNLNTLDVHLIGSGSLLNDEMPESNPMHETKLSSSTLRFQLLGTLLKPPSPKIHIPGAYIIGLTGGIATGKSAIAQHLEALGAVIIDCDKLGHKAYEPGTVAMAKIVKKFGEDVVLASGEIDRKTLGAKVFAVDSEGELSNLASLNAIVWPEIERLARLEIEKAVQARKNSENLVCVLDAAVLLEAGWNNFTNEVWVTVVSPAEAIKRVINRDGSSRENAEKRLHAQLSNEERVKNANVVFSTLWEKDITHHQIDKAWSKLIERLKPGWKFIDDNNQKSKI